MKCKYCGKEFKTGFRKKIFCSPECNQKHWKEAHKGVPTIRICEICGKEFEVSRTHKRYCSEECRMIAAKERDKNRNIPKIKTKTPKAKKQSLSFAEINERARVLGMSYGQYVTEYGL